MMLDGHIHIHGVGGDRDVCRAAMRSVGFSGGLFISPPPPAFFPARRKLQAAERLDIAMNWCDGWTEAYPFFWIDPTERSAMAQAAEAISAGIAGFKIICDRFFPGDRRVIRLCRMAAATGKPVLFHSGILWDGKPSSAFSRPAGFEALLEVDGLRFALAHIGWPWCDETIAVYGKFLNAYKNRPDLSVEMFVDITPGTPEIYRRDALTKLLTVGYDVADNVVFGTDCKAEAYNVAKAKKWLALDGGILKAIHRVGLKPAIYGRNLLRFLGLAGASRKKAIPTPEE